MISGPLRQRWNTRRSRRHGFISPVTVYTAVGPRLRGFPGATELLTGPGYAAAVCRANVALADVVQRDSDPGLFENGCRITLDDAFERGGVWRSHHPGDVEPSGDPLTRPDEVGRRRYLRHPSRSRKRSWISSTCRSPTTPPSDPEVVISDFAKYPARPEACREAVDQAATLLPDTSGVTRAVVLITDPTQLFLWRPLWTGTERTTAASCCADTTAALCAAGPQRVEMFHTEDRLDRLDRLYGLTGGWPLLGPVFSRDHVAGRVEALHIQAGAAAGGLAGPRTGTGGRTRSASRPTARCSWCCDRLPRTLAAFGGVRSRRSCGAARAATEGFRRRPPRPRKETSQEEIRGRRPDPRPRSPDHGHEVENSLGVCTVADNHGPRPRAAPARQGRLAPASRLLSRGRLLALPLSGAVRTVPTFNCDSAWSGSRGPGTRTVTAVPLDSES